MNEYEVEWLANLCLGFPGISDGTEIVAMKQIYQANSKEEALQKAKQEHPIGYDFIIVRTVK